jgi:two-component system sensor histidine kinase HydH
VPFPWRRYFRPQAFFWLLLFAAMLVFNPEPGPIVPALLVALCAVQILEPRIGTLLAVLLEFGLCYVLIGYSGGVSSSFYPILLLPVITASTNFGLLGAVFSVIAAGGGYLAFLLYLPLYNQYVAPEDIPDLVLHVLWFPMVGFFTYQLLQANREQTLKAEAAAQQLVEANQSLREAQDEVRRSERLAALGQLTAGLAHELRNPLGTMKSSAELLTRQVSGENEIAKEMAGYIAAEVDRTNSLITRFLDFARPQHLKLEKGDLSELLDHVIERFEKEKSGAAASVSVYKNYSPDVPPVAFDAQLLERALLNLVMNAGQASRAGAVVTVKTQVVETSSGRSVEVAVIDRGSGIDPKNLQSIFNPFFTTKSEGVGLGLAIVSKIIDEHGGQIAVESTLGEGSVFRLLLPVRQ